MNRFLSVKTLVVMVMLLTAGCGLVGKKSEDKATVLPDSVWVPHGEEAGRLLSEYVRIKSVNPPGNEAESAKFLAGILEKEGISYKIFESAPGRANLVARLKGDGSEKPILLLNHMDVVPAEAEGWAVEPFSGEIRDGFVWGRGTIDMKGQGIVELVAFIDAKRRNLPLKRDIIFLAVADEEQGGRFGAQWMVENHFDEVNAEYVLNEGGFGFVGLAPQLPPVYLVSYAEKGVLWLRLRARGTAGHGSIPRRDNANLKLARALQKIGEWQQDFRVPHAVGAFASAMSEGKSLPKKALYRMMSGAFYLPPVKSLLSSKEELYPEFHNTVSITVLKGGYKENVIPSESEAVLDCRLLPGTSQEKFIAELRAVIQDPDIEIEIIEWSEPSESPVNTEMFKVITQTLKKMEPASISVPFLFTAGTDSATFRKVGITSYGVAPFIMQPDDATRAHGIDERISIANLGRGVEFYKEIIERMCVKGH